MTVGDDFENGAEQRLEEAVRWRLRLAEAGLNSSPEFESWLAEAGNQAAWRQLSGLWNNLDDVAQAPEMQMARQAALADARQTRRQRQRGRMFAIAASLMIGLLAAERFFQHLIQVRICCFRIYEGQVLFNGSGKQLRILCNKSNLFSQVIEIDLCLIQSIIKDFTILRTVQSYQ